MKFIYIQNLLGVKLTEQNYEDISYPYTELCTHVTCKTVQIGGTLGTFLFGPIFAIVRKPKSNFINAMTKSGKIGVTLGLIAGISCYIKKIIYKLMINREYQSLDFFFLIYLSFPIKTCCTYMQFMKRDFDQTHHFKNSLYIFFLKNFK